MPGRSLSASHGWLNHLAVIEPVSSRIVAITIVRRRRGRRTRTDSTTPEITTSLVAPELRDRDLVGGRLVAARSPEEQVSDRREAELAELLASVGPTAGSVSSGSSSRSGRP